MPTVLRHEGFRFYFNSHEPNEPSHIHVDKDGCSAKFWLDPVSLARNSGFNNHELMKLHKLVSNNKVAFLEAWHGYFGNQG
jgi:hypothetical protein